LCSSKGGLMGHASLEVRILRPATASPDHARVRRVIAIVELFHVGQRYRAEIIEFLVDVGDCNGLIEGTKHSSLHRLENDGRTVCVNQGRSTFG
jgi:hypothetical protein